MNNGTFKINGITLAWKLLGPIVILWIVDTKYRMALGIPPAYVDVASLLTYLTYAGIALIHKARLDE